MSVTTAILLAVGALSEPTCSEKPHSDASLNWSEPATVVSPDRAWGLRVSPGIAGGENKSEADFFSCKSGSYVGTFRITRDAEVHWQRRGNYAVVFNFPVSGDGSITLYKLSKPYRSTSLNRAVGQAILQHTAGAKPTFIVPQFLGWSGRNAIISVSGEYPGDKIGPMQRYCFGIILKTSGATVSRTISEEEVRLRFQGKCPISP